jgi:hypothetical protein
LRRKRWRLRRVIALAARHRWLLLTCFAVIVVVRVALCLTTYKRIAASIAVRDPQPEASRPDYLIVWGVIHAARFVPRASCLTQALAVQYLLGRNGDASVIRVGVANSPDRGFEAHAWVIKDGRVLIGGDNEEVARFTPIVDLKPEPK